MTTSPTIKKDLIKLRESWRKIPDYGCYWSSPDNQRGLKLTPKIEPGKISVEMLIDREHSGFPGIAHGGIAYTIIDGLMGWYIMSHEGRAGFTTQMTTQYKAPLKVGKRYSFEVTLDSQLPSQVQEMISLLGQVFNTENPESKRKPLVEIRGQFFLPNRDLAQKVLGIEINNEFKELFPEN